MWAGFHRMPIENHPRYGGDLRFSLKKQKDYRAKSIGSHGDIFELINDEECKFANLPSNPEYTNFHKYFMKSKAIRKYLAEEGMSEKYQNIYRKELKEALKYEEECAVWQAQYNKYIQLAKSKIFTALREETLSAFGRSLPTQSVEESFQEIGKVEGQRFVPWDEFSHQKIPSDFWSADGIKWEESAALDGVQHFMHIYLNFKELLKIFPTRNQFHNRQVAFISGTYYVSAAKDSPSNKPPKKGRPPLNWVELYVEIARRIESGSLPQKQESFISEMQTWCETKWGVKPARSTVLEKVSPYYKEFIRKKSETKKC